MKKILIAGGTGLIGSAFSTYAAAAGYEMHILTRSQKPNQPHIYFHTWYPYKKEISNDIPDMDVIINLAGAGIADKRWSTARKKEILDSRTLTTAFLSERFPDVDLYIGASAIGYYGKRDDTDLAETEGPDLDDFMSDVCHQWEESHAQVGAKRAVVFRIGIVLSNDGGAFPKLVQPLTFGVAPYLGDGSMVYSWIHIDDVVGMMDFAINHEVSGTYNMVAPTPASQKEIIDQAAKHKRGIKIPTPTFFLKAAFGEMSDAVLMSTHVSAQKIKQAGYAFKYPDLEEAVSDLMK